MKKIAFIVRGNLKRPNKFRAEISHYFQAEFEIFLKFTRKKEHAIQIVDDLLEVHHVDYIVAVGGDGTLNEVVNGYMKAPKEVRDKAILVVYPKGRGNDFARTGGKVRDMEHLYNSIVAQKEQPLDIVQVRFTENGQEQMRYYDNSFDIGLGGLVAKYVNQSGKKWGSNLTYFSNIIKAFWSYKRVSLKLSSPDFNFEGEVLMLALNNGKYFGSGLCLTPMAVLDDGKINLALVKKISIFEFIKFYPALLSGKAIKHKELVYATLSECTIESATSCPIEMDGEVVGSVPLKVKVLKHAARLLKVE